MKHLFVVLTCLGLFSCSVQKRKYMSGYHLEWLHKKNTTNQHEPVVKASPKKTAPLANPLVQTQVATALNIAPEVNKDVKRINNIKSTSALEPDSCDLLVFKDGTEKAVKILEVSNDVIKYKRCDMPDGPLYSTYKSELFMAKYRNGVREVFKSDPNTKSVTVTASKGKGNGGGQELNTKALLSFIFGIIGLFFGFGIAAILLGNSAIEEIDAEPNRYNGRILAVIGKTLGYLKIGIIIGLIILFFAILLTF
ncbi:MAG: DUF4190 domain-containing protein [Bacteroidia bacterium]|nr:DUF4190 domain-containing protein [Bacteroidia bacterium]